MRGESRRKDKYIHDIMDLCPGNMLIKHKNKRVIELISSEQYVNGNQLGNYQFLKVKTFTIGNHISLFTLSKQLVFFCALCVSFMHMFEM